MSIKRTKETTQLAKYLRLREAVPDWLKERLDKKPDEPCKKVKYGHQETAERAASAMHKKHGGDRMESYHCAECDAWHVGHSNAVAILISRGK